MKGSFTMFESVKTYFDKKLIPEWRIAWRYLSVQLGTIYAAFAAAWPLLTETQKASLFSVFGGKGPSLLALLGFLSIIIARWKTQSGLPAQPVNNLKELGAYLSVRLSALGALSAAVWMTLDEATQNALLALLPFNINMNVVATVGFVLVVAGRLKAQPAQA